VLGTAKHLLIIDISDPRNPVQVGLYQQPSSSWFPNDVTVIDNLVLVAAGPAGLRLIDISDPANPVEVGSYERRAGWVAVKGDLAFLTARDGLRVVDISDPANPVEVGSYAMPGGAGDIALSGELVVVLEWRVGSGWLTIVR